MVWPRTASSTEGYSPSDQRGERYPFHLTDSGRYAHNVDYVRQIAAQSGLVVARLDEDISDLEYGVQVIGLFVALQKSFLRRGMTLCSPF